MVSSDKNWVRLRAILHHLKSTCTRWWWRRSRRQQHQEKPTTTTITACFSAMEVSSQLKQVFSLIDTNGDGKISPVELGEVLQRLGHEKSSAGREAEGMVKVVDLDGDEMIDFEEFMQVVGVSSSSTCGGGGGGGGEEELVEAFKVFDRNKDGYISARELRKVMAGLGGGGGRRWSLKECSKMIRGVDRNGDGLVDLEEFKLMMTGEGSHGFFS